MEGPTASVPAVGHFVEEVVTVFGGGHAEGLFEAHFVIELFPGDIELFVVFGEEIEVPGSVTDGFANDAELVDDTTGVDVVASESGVEEGIVDRASLIIEDVFVVFGGVVPHGGDDLLLELLGTICIFLGFGGVLLESVEVAEGGVVAIHIAV